MAQPEGRGFDSRWCHWNFLLSYSSQPHCDPAVDSASNRNEMFSGGKGGRCVALKPYHLHVPFVLKSGSLNLLETSGRVQACNGIDLPFFLPYKIVCTFSIKYLPF
jgi:hypothetical protein